jgi:phospholipase/lecithinase/hemolysin
LQEKLLDTFNSMVRSIGLLTLSAGLCTPAAATVTQVIAFGDSLSDTGSLYQLTLNFTGKGVPGTPYVNGRFSDGPVAVELLAEKLGVPVTSYAVGGATSSAENAASPLLRGTGVAGQVASFREALLDQAADAEALYFVWAGANDFYAGANMFDQKVAAAAVTNILGHVRDLYASGARQFLLPLMPDLSLTPGAWINGADYQAAAQARTVEFNGLLSQELASLPKELPQLGLLAFDVATYLARARPALIEQGFDVSNACFDEASKSLCTNPQQYLFWDDKHPTAMASELLATGFVQALRTQTSMIPEPSTATLLALGLVGLTGVASLRRSTRPHLQ